MFHKDPQRSHKEAQSKCFWHILPHRLVKRRRRFVSLVLMFWSKPHYVWGKRRRRNELGIGSELAGCSVIGYMWNGFYKPKGRGIKPSSASWRIKNEAFWIRSGRAKSGCKKVSQRPTKPPQRCTKNTLCGASWLLCVTLCNSFESVFLTHLPQLVINHQQFKIPSHHPSLLFLIFTLFSKAHIMKPVSILLSVMDGIFKSDPFWKRSYRWHRLGIPDIPQRQCSPWRQITA